MHDLDKPVSLGLGWPDASAPRPEPALSLDEGVPGGASPARGHDRAGWSPPPPSAASAFDHRVQFYEEDRFLYGVITAFLAEAAAKEEPLVVIATEAHRRGLLLRLEAEGFDVPGLVSSNRLLWLDAETVLSQFMADGLPDRQRFDRVVGDLIEGLRRTSGNGRVRAYGEMVDLLWRLGNAEGTLALEALWNDLGQSSPLTLLCGYCVGSFDQDQHRAALGAICDSHRRVSPAESYPTHEDPDTRLREITLLQQRALVLEREVEHRKRLEQVLQAALQQRRKVEDELRASQQELTALERELRRQNHDLSRAVRFSELFVGILGHDLRNPLSAIATAASLLCRRADSDKVAMPAGRILNSAARMSRMIDQLLDFTRIRLGEGIPVQQRSTDITEICRSAVADLESADARPLVDVCVVGDPVGLWDADRLLQLVSNLLSNAVAHGQSQSPVDVRIDGVGADIVRLDIHNTGVVPQAMLPLLFEPFRSGSDHKEARSRGLGLGLYISQQIAQAHQGRIDVTSSEADGTHFVLTLPRAATAPTPIFGAAGAFA